MGAPEGATRRGPDDGLGRGTPLWYWHGARMRPIMDSWEVVRGVRFSVRLVLRECFWHREGSR